MIIAAAACAAAGISYIFNDEEQSINTKYERVTAASTIADKQGIIKYVIHPRMIHPSLEKNLVSIINKSKSNQLELPIVNKQRKDCLNLKQDFSIVFFWSLPLKSRLVQIPTESSVLIENLNPFERQLMKISIGTQNGINNISYIPSEIALSNSDHSLDSLSYYPIVKRTKIDIDERDNNNQKRFRFDQEKIMRDVILNNVNLCVENLSKILTESCSNTDEQVTILQNSSSIISTINNNNNNTQQKSLIHSKLFQYEEKNLNLIEDGIILYRGRQFGTELGEPMIRRSNSSHSIYELNRLLTKTNCLLMQQYQIETIEDLIRLFFEQGQEHFTKLMIHLFKINPFIVEQFNQIFLKYTLSKENPKQIVQKHFIFS